MTHPPTEPTVVTSAVARRRLFQVVAGPPAGTEGDVDSMPAPAATTAEPCSRPKSTAEPCSRPKSTAEPRSHAKSTAEQPFRAMSPAANPDRGWHRLADLAWPLTTTALVWGLIAEMQHLGATDGLHAVALDVAGVALTGLAAVTGWRLAGQRRRLSRANAALVETLENMSQGIMLVDGQRRVPVINRRAIEMLGLPEQLLARDLSLDSIRAWEASQQAPGDTPEGLGEFPHATSRTGGAALNAVLERTRSNGAILEIRTKLLPNGAILRTFTDITLRRQAEVRIERLAHHDALTGLANRRQFNDQLLRRIDDATRSGHGFALLCLDLDRFKLVNDLRGHPVGDRLLRQVADRLRGVVREHDPVARLGGDEFAIVQDLADPLASAGGLARRIIDALAEPYDIDGQLSVVTVSIGIALYPDHGLTADALMQNADAALYRSKQGGQNTFRWFETEMSVRQQEGLRLRQELREAIARGSLELRYQPMLDLASRQITGVEALMRWTHPRRGLLSPRDFMQVAEEAGLMEALGRWALREACAEAASWPAAIPVTVNLSPAQLASSDLTDLVARTLKESGLAPGRLDLEVSEAMLAEHGERILAVMHDVMPSGVSVTMDNFGAGVAGLNCLRRFPFDKIKIDKALIRGLADDDHCAAIVRAVVTLGGTLGRQVVAEGVETDQQLAWLREAGCRQGQGFLLSRPMRAGRLRALLASQVQWHRSQHNLDAAKPAPEIAAPGRRRPELPDQAGKRKFRLAATSLPLPGQTAEPRRAAPILWIPAVARDTGS